MSIHRLIPNLEPILGSFASTLTGGVILIRGEFTLIELLTFLLVAVPTGIWLWWRVVDKIKDRNK